MRIPNNCMSFTPAQYWQDGKDKHLGYYNQANTSITILLYQGNTVELPQINKPRLLYKLATWFLQHCPPERLTRLNLLFTGIPMKYYQQAYKAPYPRKWKFWADRHQPNKETRIDDGMYPGASHDNAYETPFADLISLDYQAASLGFLPTTFPQFLKHVSRNENNSTAELTALISKALRLHTYRMIGKHRQLTLMRRSQSPTAHEHLLSQNTTQDTHPNTPPRTVQEPPLDDNSYSHLYYDEDDEPNLVGDQVPI
jgi:hypothetical protein